jgi:hypothetical protein
MGAGAKNLLLLLLFTIILLSSCSSALALDTARTATTIWRGQGEVDVFLRVETNDE